MDWPAIFLSLRLSLATAGILLVVGVPLAAWLTFSPCRWKVIVEAVVAIPLVLPPTVLGFYLLVAMGPRGPLGRAFESLTGGRLVFSFGGLLVASALYSLPFMVQPLCAAFAGVDRRYVESSWCLGVGRVSTFVRLVLPLARRGVVAGVVLSFAHTVGEFGVVLMVGGNIPGRTRTVSVSIYDDVQALDYARAGTTAGVLLAFSFLVLLVTYALQRRSPLAWRTP
ncbi:MAG: molybdate ABC transporter permease subunit [Leptolyngbya sp. PLA3]|nr:MAG: molybdate ABC transporter permease subunit [Cyanobacteria bacterium CYA]MCE7969965.1 molybdate ABC transporter permease subunit [Leptolyngbya sp. PL-A3]